VPPTFPGRNHYLRGTECEGLFKILDCKRGRGYVPRADAKRAEMPFVIRVCVLAGKG